MTTPSYNYGPAPQSAIVVDAHHFVLAFLFAFVRPKILLNGWKVPHTRWGHNVIPIPPGRYHLQVYVPYYLPSRVGPAELTVSVHPQQPTVVVYRAPVWTFSRGALGPSPQPWNGFGIIVGVVGGMVLLGLVFGLVPYFLLA